jgi:Uncharacterized conserved protein (DUF2190)
MSAATAKRATDSRNLGNTHVYLMKASTTIYAGTMVMLDSNGLAVPAGASASNKGVVGVALESVTSAASGSYYVTVQEGEFKFAGDTLAQGSVGGLVYADDDQTIDETQASNCPKAGILEEVVSASEGWVRIARSATL